LTTPQAKQQGTNEARGLATVMDTDLVDAIRENARRVLHEHYIGDRLHRVLEQPSSYDEELWRMAAELGWLTLAVPEEHGGLGAGIAAVAALQEELGRSLAPIPFHSSALIARALTLWPQEAVRAHWLPKLAGGETIGALGPFAANTSSLSAAHLDGSYQIDGECAPVLEGAIASLFLLPVATETGPGVALIARSMQVETQTLPVADRTRNVASLRCHNVAVPVDQVLSGAEAATVSQLLADEARLLIASDCVGGAQAILSATVDYLKIRVQFGKPIGSFQALKHRCADHKVSLEASKRLLKRAALESDAGTRSTWAGLAKFSACDCYAALAADGVQLHGGIGFTWEHSAHLFLKRAMLNQFLHGDSAQQQDRVAELLLATEHRP
jgi:alkylation response protein AidB-like acyl-CoA dehydrogenase